MSSRLDLPARKFNIQPLHHLVKSESKQDIQNLRCWIDPMQPMYQISIVWIQGNVTQVGEDSFHMTDDTGTAEIVGLSSLPAGCPIPHLGQYMMVVGELQQSGGACTVRAMKTQDLSRDRIAKQMWPMEIIDVNRRVYP